MERLRHVARSGGVDPAIVVAETVEALTGLGPAPSELVPLCRNLVERNPTCGPLWWLCAHLLAKPESPCPTPGASPTSSRATARRRAWPSDSATMPR